MANRLIRVGGVLALLATLHMAASAQTPAQPILFLGDFCSSPADGNSLFRNLPNGRFGEEPVRVYQSTDGRVYRKGRERGDVHAFALDFRHPASDRFDARAVADIPISRKVEQLKAAIEHITAATGHPRAIVVAHGMGGLVARAYIQGRGTTSKGTAIAYRSDIAALITIDTPHAGVVFGTPPADWDQDCATANTVNRREMLPPAESPFLNDLNNQPWPSGTRLDAIVSYYLDANSDTDGVVPRASQDIAALSSRWAMYPDVHTWPQRVLDPVAASGRGTLHTAVLRALVTAALVNSIVEEVDSLSPAAVSKPLDHMEPHIESPHPYPHDYDFEWVWTVGGNPPAVDVTFDARTWVEDDYDFIYVMDGNGNNVAGSPFTGASLAGRTIRVPGSTVRLRLTTDSSVTGYGLRVTALVAAGGLAPPGLPESPHPYSDNSDTTWSYTLAGNPSAIDVTFDAQTWVESDYDYIYVMTGAGAPISGSPFTGASLAGRTVRVQGATVRVRLTSDGSLTGYGFRITRVVAAGGTEGPLTPARDLVGTWRTPSPVAFTYQTDFCGVGQQVGRALWNVTWIITAVAGFTNVIDIEMRYTRGSMTPIGNCQPNGWVPFVSPTFLRGAVNGSRIGRSESSTNRTISFTGSVTTDTIEVTWIHWECLIYCFGEFTAEHALKLVRQR